MFYAPCKMCSCHILVTLCCRHKIALCLSSCMHHVAQLVEFSDFLAQHNSVLVMFYAPCKMCSCHILVTLCRRHKITLCLSSCMHHVALLVEFSVNHVVLLLLLSIIIQCVLLLSYSIHHISLFLSFCHALCSIIIIVLCAPNSLFLIILIIY